MSYYQQFHWMRLVVHKLHTLALKTSPLMFDMVPLKIQQNDIIPVQQSMNLNHKVKMLKIKKVYEEIRKDRSTQYTTISLNCKPTAQNLCKRFSRFYQTIAR